MSLEHKNVPCADHPKGNVPFGPAFDQHSHGHISSFQRQTQHISLHVASLHTSYIPFRLEYVHLWQKWPPPQYRLLINAHISGQRTTYRIEGTSQAVRWLPRNYCWTRNCREWGYCGTNLGEWTLLEHGSHHDLVLLGMLIRECRYPQARCNATS